MKHIFSSLLIAFLFTGCEKKQQEECPRCEATICPKVPTDVEVLEKYMTDFVCIEKHCYKVMRKNAPETGESLPGNPK